MTKYLISMMKAQSDVVKNVSKRLDSHIKGFLYAAEHELKKSIL